MKFILITGGVISGLGKGIITASIGRLLKLRGYEVTAIKIDPYLNIDAGTMSPLEHGEVFVLRDGGETDLDLGTYERFMNIHLTKEHNITTGKIYQSVLTKERAGEYLGKTVQIVPHITTEIQQRIESASQIVVDNKTPEICMIELGGTVGDIESSVFLEALRIMKMDPTHQFFHIHVSLLPQTSGDLKTKPTQQTIKDLRTAGHVPNAIACRFAKELDTNASLSLKEKLRIHCMVNDIVEINDVSNTYFVPELLNKQNIISIITNTINLYPTPPQSDIWRFNPGAKLTRKVVVGLVGKYNKLHDSYLSLTKALEVAAHINGIELKIKWIDAEFPTTFEGVNCLLVPGGFSSRGVATKLAAAHHALVAGIPYLGICLGCQISVINACRRLGYLSASSTEFDPTTTCPVVVRMSDIDESVMGGNMRLGLHNVVLGKDSKAYNIYDKQSIIQERYRHRYEINQRYLIRYCSDVFVDWYISGKDETMTRAQIIEHKTHPFHIGVQYHPEYESTPDKPHPLFIKFLSAA